MCFSEWFFFPSIASSVSTVNLPLFKVKIPHLHLCWKHVFLFFPFHIWSGNSFREMWRRVRRNDSKSACFMPYIGDWQSRWNAIPLQLCSLAQAVQQALPAQVTALWNRGRYKGPQEDIHSSLLPKAWSTIGSHQVPQGFSWSGPESLRGWRWQNLSG